MGKRDDMNPATKLKIDNVKRESLHRCPTHRKLSGYVRHASAPLGKPRNECDCVIDCAEKLHAKAALPFLVPDCSLFEFGGSFRFCKEPVRQRFMRRRDTWARTSFQGFAVDSPAMTRRARASISLAQAVCTAVSPAAGSSRLARSWAAMSARSSAGRISAARSNSFPRPVIERRYPG